MSNSNAAASGGCLSGGVGLLCILTFIVFLVLKLAEVGVVASWPWWVVTAPIWGYFAVILAILALLLLVALVAITFMAGLKLLSAISNR